MDIWNNAGAQFRFTEDVSATNGFCCHDRGRTGIIAETYSIPMQPNTALREVQVEVNLHYEFDPPQTKYQSQSRGGSAYDLKTVLVHELGHALGLLGSIDQAAVMHEQLTSGTAKGLHPDDFDEIRRLYP